MATVCTHCGNELLKDDARFCNNCGMLVPSHPFSPQSLSASKAASSASQPEKPAVQEQAAQPPREKPHEKPVLREQIAHQPRPRLTQRISQDDLSAHPSWPTPMTHVSVKAPSVDKKNGSREAISQREEFPAQAAQALPSTPSAQATVSNEPPKRELRVKIWEQDTNESSSVPVKEEEAERDAIEELPTTPLAVPKQSDSQNPAQQVSSAATVPQQSQIPPLPQPAIRPVARPIQRPSAISGREKPKTPVPASFLSPSSRRSRVPLVVLLASLCVLVLGGGAWLLVVQPFTVPAVTKPLQDFKDTRIGISLSYPSSWTVQQSGTMDQFTDSSRTAQFNLAVVDSSSDAAQYLQQQSAKASMTSIKTLIPLSFAGTTWQQVQGTVQKSGANYTETMLATMHGNHLFVLTQLAPQSTYNDEESVVFAGVRSSLQFIQ